MSFPCESGRLVLALASEGKVNVPESFGYKTFDEVPFVYDESKSRKLAGTFELSMPFDHDMVSYRP